MNLRNKPCQCGSGKKYKHCCGDNAEKARRNQEAWKEPPLPAINTTFRRETRNRMGMSSIALIAAAMMGGQH